MSADVYQLRRELIPHVQWLLSVARHYGIPVTVTSTLRSRRKQAQLYRDYLAGRSKWPANPPGTSAHEYGLAWDSVVPPEYQQWWNEIRRWQGWSVPASDEIHAGVPNWRRYIQGG